MVNGHRSFGPHLAPCFSFRGPGDHQHPWIMSMGSTAVLAFLPRASVLLSNLFPPLFETGLTA